MKNFVVEFVKADEYGAYMCGHENVFVDAVETVAETAEIAKSIVKGDKNDIAVIGCYEKTTETKTAETKKTTEKKAVDPIKTAKAQQKRYMTEIEKAKAEIKKIQRQIAKYEKKVAEYEKIING